MLETILEMIEWSVESCVYKKTPCSFVCMLNDWSLNIHICVDDENGKWV